IRIAGQRSPDLDGIRSAGQNGDAVPTLLAVPDHTIAGFADGCLRELLLWRFQLLQANDIRRSLAQPAQQARQTGADAVGVVGYNLHPSSSRSTPSSVRILTRSSCASRPASLRGCPNGTSKIA